MKSSQIEEDAAMLYTAGSIEIGGKEYEAEVDYEMFDGRLTVHAVRAAKVVSEKDTDVWYDRNGEPHRGRKVIFLDVTDFVSRAAWEEEISEYLKYLYEAKRKAA